MQVEEDRIERQEREKVLRRHKFYDEYAKDQLSRIITSLMKSGTHTIIDEESKNGG